MEENVIKQKLNSPKGKQKKISAEASLANDMPKGKGSKTNPSNKSLDGEDFLADMPKGNKTVKKASGKAPSNKKLDAEDYLADAPKFRKSVKKGNKKLKPESDLSKMPKYGKGHNNTSKSMDAEEYLADSKYMKSFESFINEDYVNETFDQNGNPYGFYKDDSEEDILAFDREHEGKTYLEVANGKLKLTNNKEHAHCFLDDEEAEDFVADHNISVYQLTKDDSGENFTIIELNSLEGAEINLVGNYSSFGEEQEEENQMGIWKDQDLGDIKRPYDLDQQSYWYKSRNLGK